MEGLITALLLVIQVVNGNPVNQECCASKNVGDYSYTRVDTSDGFPDACLAPCAYRRDDQPEGSLYCFAAGSLAVKCTGEKPEIMSFEKTVGPLGNLPDPMLFIDNHIGPVNNISIFTGKSGSADIAVLGIAITYEDSTREVHGNTGPGNLETPCERNIRAGQRFGRIMAQSEENDPTENNNLIFQLTFLDTLGGTICFTPKTTGGKVTIDKTPENALLLSISGNTTTLLNTDQPQIASLTFHY